MEGGEERQVTEGAGWGECFVKSIAFPEVALIASISLSCCT